MAAHRNRDLPALEVDSLHSTKTRHDDDRRVLEYDDEWRFLRVRIDHSRYN